MSKDIKVMPELRFPEFKNERDWEIKQIDDLCDILNNIRKPISSNERKNGVYPYYGASGIIDFVDDYLFDERLLLVGEDGAKWGAYEGTALLLGQDPLRSAGDLKALLQSMATDIGAAGPDNVFGAGKLRLEPPVTYVTALGPVWISGDTRAQGYTNATGTNQLVSGRTSTETALIAARVRFVAPGPGGAAGSLRLTTPAAGDKATLEDRGIAVNPFDPAIHLEYRWYRSPTSVGVAAPALKLGLNTTEANPTGTLAADRGENRIDKLLVYEPYLQGPTSSGTWKTETINLTTGKFWLVNLTAPTSSALPATSQAVTRTLSGWATVFGTGLSPSAVSLQLGAGSGNAGHDGYVEYVELGAGPGTLSRKWSFFAAP